MLEPNQCIIAGTSGSSTDGGGAVPWFVLWVNSKAERSVRDNLLREGFEAFVATRFEIHTWRRGERRKIEKVLIPSVVFVRMNKEDRRIIEDFPNVRGIMYDPARKREGVNSWDTLARISEEEMNFFKQMLGQEETEVQFASADFSVGDYVRIKDLGDTQGKAQIVRIFGDNKTYVGVRVSFLGCAYMEIKKSRIVKL